jgi:hypothetical protein
MHMTIRRTIARCRIGLALSAGLLAAGALAPVTHAQTAATPPAVASTADECLKAAFDMAQLAEDTKLSTEALDQVEGMLGKMEDHCDANRFAEAAALAVDIKQFITKQ